MLVAEIAVADTLCGAVAPKIENNHCQLVKNTRMMQARMTQTKQMDRLIDIFNKHNRKDKP